MEEEYCLSTYIILMEDYFKYDIYYLITKKKYIWNIIDDFKSIANSSISKVGMRFE